MTVRLLLCRLTVAVVVSVLSCVHCHERCLTGCILSGLDGFGRQGCVKAHSHEVSDRRRRSLR